MRHLSIFITLLGLLLILSSCGRDNHVPSGRARKTVLKENRSHFRAKRDRKSRPPQMGFYRKKEKRNVFEAISFRVRYTFAGKDRKRQIGNERRSSSVKASQRKARRSASRTNKTFVKGKVKSSPGRRKKDKSADSFARNANKKKGFLIFGRGRR